MSSTGFPGMMRLAVIGDLTTLKAGLVGITYKAAIGMIRFIMAMAWTWSKAMLGTIWSTVEITLIKFLTVLATIRFMVRTLMIR